MRILESLIPGETLLDRWHQRQSHVGQSRRVLLAWEICAQPHWAWIRREGCARSHEWLFAQSCTHSNLTDSGLDRTVPVRERDPYTLAPLADRSGDVEMREQ